MFSIRTKRYRIHPGFNQTNESDNNIALFHDRFISILKWTLVATKVRNGYRTRHSNSTLIELIDSMIETDKT